jgi:tetratricopeptide (TPR) repeat protein
MEHSDFVRCVAFSPDGKLIVTGSANEARLWDAATGLPIGKPLVHSDMVVSLGFSPDGQAILTGSWDNSARLWDATTGNPIGRPLAQSGFVSSAVFSPDGRTILIGCSDHTARLWDFATGLPLGQSLPQSEFVNSMAFSPDGRTIVTGSSDRVTRLWDAATGQPIGPALSDVPSGVCVTFSPDGRFILMSDSSGFRRWDAPVPVPDDLPRLATWVEAATGLELDNRGSVRVLDGAAWAERRRRLSELGGPPLAVSRTRLDPILYGANPTARAAALAKEGLWEQAEAAYKAAARARPFHQPAWRALARFQRSRGHLDRAAATCAEAVQIMPANFTLRVDLGRLLLESNDREGWRSANDALLERFGGTTNVSTANLVAWACALGPDGSADPEIPVRLAEGAVRGATDGARPGFLNTLGATLYRAGRFDEALRRLEEAIKQRGKTSTPADWAFLAMAHMRLGHRAQARRWLERLRDYQPSAKLAQWSDELALSLVRREAEAMVLYDPVFPDDPFAH